MKKLGLWTIALVLMLCGLFMFAIALAERDTNPDIDIRIAEAHDPKLREILRERQHEQEMEDLKARVEYITIAALEVSLAAFLVGRARR